VLIVLRAFAVRGYAQGCSATAFLPAMRPKVTVLFKAVPLPG
jgi:hypothetical protein